MQQVGQPAFPVRKLQKALPNALPGQEPSEQVKESPGLPLLAVLTKPVDPFLPSTFQPGQALQFYTVDTQQVRGQGIADSGLSARLGQCCQQAAQLLASGLSNKLSVL